MLAVDLGTVDAILSGNAEYDPMWESGLSNLIQRLDLPVVRRKIRGLDALLQQEQEKKIGIDLFWSFRSFLSKQSKSPFKFAGQPVTVQDEPDHTLFVLQREDGTEKWYIQYYSSALDEDALMYVYDQAEAVWKTALENRYNSEDICVAVAFSNEESYNMTMDYFQKANNEKELGEDLDRSRGMPANTGPIVPDMRFILVDTESKRVKTIEMI